MEHKKVVNPQENPSKKVRIVAMPVTERCGSLLIEVCIPLNISSIEQQEEHPRDLGENAIRFQASKNRTMTDVQVVVIMRDSYAYTLFCIVMAQKAFRVPCAVFTFLTGNPKFHFRSRL